MVVGLLTVGSGNPIVATPKSVEDESIPPLEYTFPVLFILEKH